VIISTGKGIGVDTTVTAAHKHSIPNYTLHHVSEIWCGPTMLKFDAQGSVNVARTNTPPHNTHILCVTVGIYFGPLQGSN